MAIDVTSEGTHRRLLERALIYTQALGDLTNPTVLWLKILLEYKQKQYHDSVLLFFFIVKNDHGTFLNDRKMYIL